MKNLKFKSIFFSLMAVIMLTVFLTSCEKNDVVPSDNEITEQDEITREISNLLISTVDENVDLKEFISNSTIEEITKYQNDYIAYEYLSELGEFEEVLEEIADGFSHDKAIEVLSTEQQNELKSKLISPLLRGAWCWPIKPGVCITVPTKVCSKSKWGITVKYPCSYKRKCAVEVNWTHCIHY